MLADGCCRTELNSLNSPLLRLPGEVRNLIYQYALGGKVISVESNWGDIDTTFMLRSKTGFRFAKGCMPVFSRCQSPTKKNLAKGANKLFPLTTVCRQLASETLGFVHKHNFFMFNSVGEYRRCARKFTQEQRNAITEFAFACNAAIGDMYARMIFLRIHGRDPDGITQGDWHRSGLVVFREAFPNLDRVLIGDLAREQNGPTLRQQQQWMLPTMSEIRILGNPFDAGLEIVVQDPMDGSARNAEGVILKDTV